MSINRVVLNASPLICLSKSGLADLLPTLFPEVFVPEAVFQEVMAERKTDFVAEWLSAQRRINRLRDIPIDPRVAAWDLGEGESAVLSFALRNEDCWAVMDDREARRCAMSLKCRFIGTLGVIVLAKKRGIIKSVRENLQKLQADDVSEKEILKSYPSLTPADIKAAIAYAAELSRERLVALPA